MKKQLVTGIMALVLAGACGQVSLAKAAAVLPENNMGMVYATTDVYTPSGNNQQVIINQPANPQNPGTVKRDDGTYKKPGDIRESKQKLPKNPKKFGVQKNKPHKGMQQAPVPGEIAKPNKPNNGVQKPAVPGKVHKPSKPHNGSYRPTKPNNGSYKPAVPGRVYKPSQPNNGSYKPAVPGGVYKPNKPNNGTYKPAKPNQGTYKPTSPSQGRTRVHGAHWCYGACSLHDAGLHNAPRTQKHWCDGYR